MTGQNLVGIAALAASGTRLATKRHVEYRSLPSKSILNRCSNPQMPFRWTVNPYRGCEIGCHYCYAPYTHTYLGLDDPADFDTLIFSKERAREILEQELRRGVDGPIALGTGTDPYQPAERRFETTRGILEAFSRASGLRIGITTKSDLILRDLDLLGKIAAQNDLRVNMTVTTMDDALARLLEPRAVRPEMRIETVRQLRWRGVRAGVFSAPVLPLLTDSADILGAVAEQAKRADAQYWTANPLFLKEAARRRLLPVLEQWFPKIAERYRSHYRSRSYVARDYQDWLQARVEGIRSKYGLASAIPFAVDPAGGILGRVQQSLFAESETGPVAQRRGPGAAQGPLGEAGRLPGGVQDDSRPQHQQHAA